MARARVIKPGFFKNELLAELPFEGRRLFAGLWTLADREGRLEDRPKRIKAEIFPFDEVDVIGLLTALESRGFVERYTSGATPLIQVVEFLKHQTPHHREPASVLPGPALGQPRTSPPVYGNGSDPVCGNGSICTEPQAAAVPFLAFPVVGSKEPLWTLTEAHVIELEALFPNVDVRAEARKALAWAKANPGRRKTGRGMPAFLARWLGREVDTRGGKDRRGEDRRNGFTPAELKHARDVRTRVWLGCRHEPRCAGIDECVQRIAADIRAKAS